jgi:hypothetical protein
MDSLVASDGDKNGNPHHLKRQLKHLKRQQRRPSRMTRCFALYARVVNG